MPRTDALDACPVESRCVHCLTKGCAYSLSKGLSFRKKKPWGGEREAGEKKGRQAGITTVCNAMIGNRWNLSHGSNTFVTIAAAAAAAAGAAAAVGTAWQFPLLITALSLLLRAAPRTCIKRLCCRCCGAPWTDQGSTITCDMSCDLQAAKNTMRSAHTLYMAGEIWERGHTQGMQAGSMCIRGLGEG